MDKPNNQYLDKFLAKISPEPNSGCWLWTGALTGAGYGNFFTQRPKPRNWLAHRVTYAIYVGKIPKHLELDHLCRMPACCNPDHLEAVAHRVNAQRGDVGQRNANKTHCPKGHEYTPQNIYTYPPKHARCCKQCGVERARKYRAEKRNRDTAPLAPPG